ncbi:hypothetical protein OG689_27035 [Kitasatospora sp. NBC_00240]|uniref:hypothetical protein n=1 Tax=Kitasatospora sp. NBC_00240 TaxID=2903567 RepID=UPI00224E48D2|nr:hypothetical protein [Kitasatospora sp. NBC_00240]MCX5212885.1 hypothetical protein [Kitasatospora sp. NBC_00240]
MPNIGARALRPPVRAVLGLAAALVLAAGGGAAFASTGSGGPSAAASPSAAPSPSATVPPVAAPAAGGHVQVLQPHQGVEIGRGLSLWLDHGSENVVAKEAGAPGGSWSAKVADLPEGRISLTVSGDATSALVVGMYRGVGAVDRVTVALGGTPVEAHVVSLPGNPGWAAFHVEIPGAAAPSVSTPTVTAYGADGAVLAGFAKK